MKLLTFFLFLGAFTLQSFANVYLVKNLNLPRISGPRFFFATEGRVLLTIFGTLLFIYLLSGLWNWHLVILFLVISQLAVILGTVLNAALGSSSEKSRSRISAAMGEIGLNHPIIYTLSNFLAGFTLLGFLVAAAVAHFRYAWGSQPLYIAAVKYTLIGMIFVPNIQIWGRMAAILSSEDLDEDTVTRLTETAVKAYRAVRLRDYGRIDMRLSPKGEVYVIEANPNPWLSSGQEFAMAAKKSGLSYTQMIEEIVDLAMARNA